MKNFVKLIQQVHEERFSVVMNKIIGRKIPVAFLSIAPTTQAVEITKNLRAQGINITKLVVIDNTPPPVNLDFDVVHVRDAAQIYPQPEYILAPDFIDSRVAVKNFSLSKVLNLNWGNTNHIYETFMTHLPELQEVYESLIDEASKKTFCGYWLGRISSQFGKFVFSDEAHHFINGFIPERGGIVIEAGAYDGGTATVFSEMGYKVYSFELDKQNYDIASKAAVEKNFVIENFGLGSYKHEMNYVPEGLASRLDLRGSAKAQIITVDSYVRENNLPRVDLIRLDVEGAELDALKGATATIARYKPILSLSAYHKLDDFWTLMNFVKSIRPDYEFALRHLYDTPEDIPKDFSEERINNLVSLGLEPVEKSYVECVLFAR